MDLATYYGKSGHRANYMFSAFLGSIAEMMGNLDGAMDAYESAIRQNSYSIPAMESISHILRTREQFPKAVEYLQAILNIDANNGEVWGSLGMHAAV
jgi:tetratricopeptide (TPR) repeat protein